MTDNDYDSAFEQGRSGQMYTGSNSIDYAGYLQGQQTRADAEALKDRYSGGGGPSLPPMNLKQKAARFGVFGALLGLPLGAFIDTSVLGAAAGVAGGFALAFAARLLLEVVIRPFRPKSEASSDVMGPLAAALLGGLGGNLIGGPLVGAGAAAVLVAIWVARNRR